MKSPEDRNPKRSVVLDSLRKPEVRLLAFPADAYAEKSGTHEINREFSRRLPSLARSIRREESAQEFMRRLKDAAEIAFSTKQYPLILTFSSGVYAAFVPDRMSSDELRAFKTSVMLHGLRLASIIARKTGGVWTYELC